jgi:O-antigen ligase
MPDPHGQQDRYRQGMSDSNNSLEDSPSWASIGTACLDRAPRYLIIFLIFYAPFCYGLRDGAGEGLFVSIGFIAFFIFGWKRYLDGEWPRVPTWMLFCMTFIAIQGLWMCLNADSYYRWHREMITVRILDTATFPSLPGARDRFAGPIQFYPQLTVFCLMIVIINFTTKHRHQLVAVIVLCATAFSLVGIVMKIAGPSLLSVYWKFDYADSYQTVFAAYRYHGNAATFLAIGYALSLGLFIQCRRDGYKLGRILVPIGATTVALGIVVNTSRAGWSLAVTVTCLLGVRLFIETMTGRERQSDTKRVVLSSLIVLATASIGIAAIFSADSFRLGKIETVTESLATRFPLFLFLKMIPETPFLGFGPGSFSLVFPKYQMANPGMFPLNTYLNEAHQDYFQLFFDWGYPGLLCWLLILLLPTIVVVSVRSSHRITGIQLGCLTGALAACLHATMDFPLQITSILFLVGIILSILTQPAIQKRAI